MPLGAINFMYFFSSLVNCFLVLFILKYQSGARKAATGTSIINKSGFTFCQSTVWKLSTGCISAVELCTQSQSIVTNFISRIRNICHIHEDVIMHTCNFMKTPNLALAYMMIQLLVWVAISSPISYSKLHVIEEYYSLQYTQDAPPKNQAHWKWDTIHESWNVFVFGNSPTESQFDFSMGSWVPFPMKRVF